MKCIGSGSFLMLIWGDGVQHPFQLSVKIFVMNRAGFCQGMKFDGIRKDADTGCIPLFSEKVNQRGSNVDRKGNLVWMIDGRILNDRIIHRRGIIDEDLATEVRFLFVSL